MALFGKKKTEEKEVAADLSGKASTQAGEKQTKTAAPATPQTALGGRDYSRVLRQPRITEKATMVTENGAYVFEIDPRATKEDVKKAVIEFYKVTPQKVNITRIPSKKIQSRRRGVFGTKPAGKKAYVYLKQGDTIDIV